MRVFFYICKSNQISFAMKPFLIGCLLITLSFQTVYAQPFKSGTLVDVNNVSYTGQFYIDHENALLRYRDGQTSKVFGYSQIQYLTIAGNEIVVKNYESQNLLLTTLVKGKATLYEKNNKLFFIENQNNLREINTSENTFLIPGTLNLLFNDCNSIREPIARVSNFNRSALIRLTEQYNQCDYSESFELTDKEIRESKRFKSDVFSFYAGAGLTLSKTSYKEADKNSVLPQLSLGVLVSPGFLGSLQHKLHFGTDVSYGLAQSQTLNYANESLEFKLHSFVYALETQFHFNSSGNIQPYVGIGANFHSDRYKGELNGERFNSMDGGFNYNLKAGLIYKTGKNQWGWSLRYIPEFTSDASFFNSQGTFTPLDINNSYIASRIEFYF